MEHTYEELKTKTVQELREIAKGIEHAAVQGYTQMNKERLIPAICTALGIDAHQHHVAVGIDKRAIKAKIRALKTERDKLVESRATGELKKLRRQIHRLKHELRAHMA